MLFRWARVEGVARVGIRNALDVVGADKNEKKSQKRKSGEKWRKMGNEILEKNEKMWKISIKKSPSQMVGVGGKIPIGRIGDEK